MVISDGAPVDDTTLSANSGNYLEKHLKQINKYEYNWITPEIKEKCIHRLNENLGHEFKNKSKIEVENQLIHYSNENEHVIVNKNVNCMRTRKRKRTHERKRKRKRKHERKRTIF